MIRRPLSSAGISALAAILRRSRRSSVTGPLAPCRTLLLHQRPDQTRQLIVNQAEELQVAPFNVGPHADRFFADMRDHTDRQPRRQEAAMPRGYHSVTHGHMVPGLQIEQAWLGAVIACHDGALARQTNTHRYLTVKVGDQHDAGGSLAHVDHAARQAFPGKSGLSFNNAVGTASRHQKRPGKGSSAIPDHPRAHIACLRFRSEVQERTQAQILSFQSPGAVMPYHQPLVLAFQALIDLLLLCQLAESFFRVLQGVWWRAHRYIGTSS